MKDVTLIDRTGQMSMLLCEKHFTQYQDKMLAAAAGGTAYISQPTNRRGCVFCKKVRTKK